MHPQKGAPGRAHACAHAANHTQAHTSCRRPTAAPSPTRLLTRLPTRPPRCLAPLTRHIPSSRITAPPHWTPTPTPRTPAPPAGSIEVPDILKVFRKLHLQVRKWISDSSLCAHHALVHHALVMQRKGLPFAFLRRLPCALALRTLCAKPYWRWLRHPHANSQHLLACMLT